MSSLKTIPDFSVNEIFIGSIDFTISQARWRFTLIRDKYRAFVLYLCYRLALNFSFNNTIGNSLDLIYSTV